MGADRRAPSIDPLGSVGALLPSPPLAAYVAHYWFNLGPAQATTVLLPEGCIDVVMEQTYQQTRVTVYGSVTARTTLALTPGARYVGVQFRPAATRHFLDMAAHVLTDGALDGHGIVRWDMAPALDAHDPLKAIARLDAALSRHLERLQPAPSRIDHLVTALEAVHGALRIDELARRFGVSRRQIERDFLDTVGLAPKAFADILRFCHASRLVSARTPLSIAAQYAGYADQSHLTREFRRFAGLTPTAYARGDVAFLQDSKVLIDEDDGFPFVEEPLL